MKKKSEKETVLRIDHQAVTPFLVSRYLKKKV